MAIVCARGNCIRSTQPASEDGLERYVTILCARRGKKEGYHQGVSSYVHAGCAVELELTLVARVEYLPFCQEMAVNPEVDDEEKLYDCRAPAYYYCGHPACLVDLIKIYGSNEVKQVLEAVEAEPERSLDELPLLEEPAMAQLRVAMRQVGHRVGLGRGAMAAQGRAVAQQQAVRRPVKVMPELAATAAEDIQSRLRRGDHRRPNSKNILLVGAGAVGSFFASKLLLDGHRVVIVDRPEQVSAILPVGLHLQEGLLADSVQPTALVTALEEAFPARVDYDLLLLATKAYDVSPILKQMPGSNFSLPRKVMTIQNGVGAEETVKKLLGARHVLAASLTVPVSVESAGSVVVERHDCGLGLAPMAIGERVDEWVKMFTMAGIKTVAYRDYRAMKWSKLLLNIVANATCAILNRQPGVIYRYRPTFELERAMLKETLAVMKKMGVSVVDLPGTPARLLPPIINYLPGFLAKMVLEPQIRNGRGDKMPSLQLDLAAGRKQSEVIFMNGAVVREGRRLGVPTPVNFLLADTLHKLFQKVLLWDDFRGKPDALLALLRRR